MTDDDDVPTTYAWVRRTNGSLSDTQRKAARAGIRRGYGDLARGLAVGTFRRSRAGADFPSPPDSRLAREAEVAAQEQSAALVGHGYRTWLIGAALAEHDGSAVDAELLYVTSLLHDSGMMTEVVGEDFTARSAAILLGVGDRAAAAERGMSAADAAVSHASPGLTYGDNAVGFYVQAGAMADLAGLRMWDLPRGYVRRAFQAHPANGVHSEVPALIRREARDVPDGRFALLHKARLDLMVTASPTRRFARDRPG